MRLDRVLFCATSLYVQQFPSSTYHYYIFIFEVCFESFEYGFLIDVLSVLSCSCFHSFPPEGGGWDEFPSLLRRQSSLGCWISPSRSRTVNLLSGLPIVNNFRCSVWNRSHSLLRCDAAQSILSQFNDKLAHPQPFQSRFQRFFLMEFEIPLLTPCYIYTKHKRHGLKLRPRGQSCIMASGSAMHNTHHNLSSLTRSFMISWICWWEIMVRAFKSVLVWALCICIAVKRPVSLPLFL